MYMICEDNVSKSKNVFKIYYLNLGDTKITAIYNSKEERTNVGEATTDALDLKLLSLRLQWFQCKEGRCGHSQGDTHHLGEN